MNAPVEFRLPDTVAGYKTFTLGEFTFQRDEYFVTITWPAKGQRQSHTMSADAFLRAIMRGVAWGFFYGLVSFDTVSGTRNLYGRVELFAGRYNESLHKAGLSYVEVFDSPVAMKKFKEILADWVNEGFDPFAAAERRADREDGLGILLQPVHGVTLQSQVHDPANRAFHRAAATGDAAPLERQILQVAACPMFVQIANLRPDLVFLRSLPGQTFQLGHDPGMAVLLKPRPHLGKLPATLAGLQPQTGQGSADVLYRMAPIQHLYRPRFLQAGPRDHPVQPLPNPRRSVRHEDDRLRFSRPQPMQMPGHQVHQVVRPDHWSFWKEGYPALMLTDTALFRYPEYHGAGDVPARVAAREFARAAYGIIHTVRALAETPKESR